MVSIENASPVVHTSGPHSLKLTNCAYSVGEGRKWDGWMPNSPAASLTPGVLNLVTVVVIITGATVMRSGDNCSAYTDISLESCFAPRNS